MRRAVKLSLSFITGRKRRQIAALLEAYRAAVNFYIRSLWNERGQLDKATLARLQNTRLSERYKSQALKQALEMVSATRKRAQELRARATCPTFTGSAILDAKFVSIEEGHGRFNLAIRLSTLNKGERITILTKKTAVFDKWAAWPGSKCIQGCALSEDHVIIWFAIPDRATKETGRIIGLDVGINKLMADSEGHHYGTEFKKIRDKVKRRRPGSQRRQAACIERERFINRTVKQLPFGHLRAIGIEDLKNVKKGKKSGRGKKFRKAVAPWTYRHVLNRIEQHAQENRVLLVRVDPANTSRTCPVSTCGAVHKENRKGEKFQCLVCGHQADADTVGALTILARTLETLRSAASLMPQN
jgi:IS605 OrfB family transposase